MAHYKPTADLATHRVANQSPPFEDINLYQTDPSLTAAIAANDARHLDGALSTYGDKAGSAEAVQWSRHANKHKPDLVGFDRFGHRLDEVEFHPAYHKLMDLGFSAGIASAPWTGGKNGHSHHAALLYMMSQVDGGVCCPMSMTYAATPALRHSKALSAEWIPRITAGAYDPRFIPAAEKKAATLGMAMTEKQGGSDIRANETRAHKVGRDVYELTGHKWFCSAPMSDGFLTLARTEAGISCFLVPRWRPDGTRNAIHIMRLKDKMGDRSNASSEIEYHGAYARLIGDEARGVRTIIDMVMHTRLDCVVGSAGGMRAAFAQAHWHASHRTAFQKKLIAQPAMSTVLGDLALESWAATTLAFHLAMAFDQRKNNNQADAFARLATAIAKFWVCKRQSGMIAEALECFGGAGFVEESEMPRLFRTSPLNAIWEGSGNVIALDILRALSREPESLEAVQAELQSTRGAHPLLDAHLNRTEGWLKSGALTESTARAFAEDMGLALQAAALKRVAPDLVFDAFCEARLDRDNRHLGYGALPAKFDARAIVDSAIAFRA